MRCLNERFDCYSTPPLLCRGRYSLPQAWSTAPVRGRSWAHTLRHKPLFRDSVMARNSGRSLQREHAVWDDHDSRDARISVHSYTTPIA